MFNQEQLLDRICMALGGRAAEQIFFGKVSTGAADDLKRVTQIAYAEVTTYGFSERIGQVSFQQDSSDSGFTKPYSEATGQAIDEEVRQIVSKAYDRTIKLVTEKKAEIQAVADRLLEKETINHDDVVELLGQRPFATDAYKEFMAENARRGKLASAAEEGKKKASEAAASEEEGEDGDAGDLQPNLASTRSTVDI